MELPVKIYYKGLELDFPEYKWTYKLVLEHLLNASTPIKRFANFEIDESTRYVTYSGLHYEVIGTIEDIKVTLSMIYLR